MRIISIIIFVSISMVLGFGKSFAVTILDSAPADTPTPEASELSSNNSKSETANVVANQGWIAPSEPANESPFRLALNSVFQNDVNNYQTYSMLDIYAKRDLDEYSIRAEGIIRVRKSFSNDDETNVPIELRLAKVSFDLNRCLPEP